VPHTKRTIFSGSPREQRVSDGTIAPHETRIFS
jgi:hypothetical protein